MVSMNHLAILMIYNFLIFDSALMAGGRYMCPLSNAILSYAIKRVKWGLEGVIRDLYIDLREKVLI